MRRKYPNAEEDNTVSFCFKDQDNGLVGLDFKEEIPCSHGWVVKPEDPDMEVSSSHLLCIIENKPDRGICSDHFYYFCYNTPFQCMMFCNCETQCAHVKCYSMSQTTLCAYSVISSYEMNNMGSKLLDIISVITLQKINH